ncbi:MAG: response regulator [Fibromonadaceae bacterium]|jgi:signal transduction histidine kinase/CheY-like chemotaxis protein/HPt (histidine-containing phosphotransfer) domain-containing protein|nr:response regulator [Fibromonadaceae bacterium]
MSNNEMLSELERCRAAMEYDLMKYKLTSDTLGIALWDMDVVSGDPINPNNKFTWSQEFRNMLGFSDESDFPNVLYSWSDRLHPEDKEMTLSAFAAHIVDRTGKTPYDLEYRLLLKDESYRSFRAFGTTLRDSEGVPLRVAGALEDITEKKQMEEKLAYREKLLDALDEMDIMLLSHKSKTFDEIMSDSLKPIAEAADLDTIVIYVVVGADSGKNFRQMYRWDKVEGGATALDKKLKYWPDTPVIKKWKAILSKNKVVNTHAGKMSAEESAFLSTYDVKSILLTPIFVSNEIWGAIAYQDHVEERCFDSDCINFLSSAARLCANAIIRHEKKQDTIKLLKSLEKREKMASTLNQAAEKFLLQKESSFEKTMTAGVKLIVDVLDIDRFSLWSNFVMSDGLYASQIYRWDKDSGGTTTPTVGLEAVAYSKLAPHWEELFKDGKTINSPVSLLPEAATLKSFGVVSAYVTPLIINNEVWGFALFEDRHIERYFDEESTEMMRSAAFLCANTVIMNEKTQSIVKALEALKNREKMLAYQLEQQRLVSEISKNFVSFGDTCSLINEAIGKLGKRFSASRMFIVSIDYEHKDIKAEYQWYANNDVPRFKSERNFDIFSMIISSFPKYLTEGSMVPTVSCKNTAKEKNFEMLKTIDLISFICTPLYIESSLWGVIIVADCFTPRDWSEDEESFFAMTSSIIAGAIMRNIYEAKLKETIIKVTNLSKAKDEFLSKISHEIRTPMNAILGLTGIQLQNEALPHGTREGLNIIYNSGYSLLRIINDLLDLSKIEAQKLEIVPAKYRIASLINDTAQLNMMRIESKPIEFKLEIADNIPTEFFGDELRIKQILNNILSNAFKYTDSGEVSMSVSAEKNEDESSDIMLTFSVSDTGHGMAEEHLHKIFDEYSRFNLASTNMIEGTGLGMTITRSLVNLMQGSIAAESELGKGSVFTIRLPQKSLGSDFLSKGVIENLKKFRVSSSSKKINVTREPMPYGKVLIVDDVESNLYVAKRILDPYGLSVETVTSGFEAIERVETGCIYDIIFMDHMMPKMDGIEAVKIIRELGYTHTIIALTANAVAGQAEVFLENGFDSFVSKPIDVYHLNAELNKFIRDKQPPEVIAEARRQKNEGNAALNGQKADNAALHSTFVQDAEKVLLVFESTLENIEGVSDVDLRLFTVSVHAIKSALMNIGEIALSQLAFTLEKAGKDHDKRIIKAQTQDLIDSLRIIIKRIESESEATATTDEDTSFLHEQLKIINKACQSYDARTANKALSDLRKLSWTKETKTLLDKIANCILLSEFEEAGEFAKSL